MSTLRIDGTPVAVVPATATEDMLAAAAAAPDDDDWMAATAKAHCAMIAAADPSLTAAVVEMREAMYWLVGHMRCAMHPDMARQRWLKDVLAAEAALARITVTETYDAR